MYQEPELFHRPWTKRGRRPWPVARAARVAWFYVGVQGVLFYAWTAQPDVAWPWSFIMAALLAWLILYVPMRAAGVGYGRGFVDGAAAARDGDALERAAADVAADVDELTRASR